MSLGERIKTLRIHSKLSQEELAEKTRISRSNIGKIENDKIIPNCSFILAFSNFFGVSTDWLISSSEFIHNETVLPQLDEKKLSSAEESLILKLRLMDEVAKDDIMCFVDVKYQRILNDMHKK